MLLSHHQAEAVYGAMCALNNVCGRIRCTVQELIHVQEFSDGIVFVSRDGSPAECYLDQEAFASAYGLG